MPGFLVSSTGEVTQPPECDPGTHVWVDSPNGKSAWMRCDKCLTIMTVRKDLMVRIMGDEEAK